MKSLYFILSTLAFGTINAQQFTFTTDKVLNYEYEASSMQSLDIKFTCNEVADVSLRWFVIENTLPQGWSYSICDYGNCYVGAPTDTKTMNELTAQDISDGTEAFFKLSCTPMDIYGAGELKMYVFDPVDGSAGDTVTYSLVYNDPLFASVNNTDLSEMVEVFPNPSVDFTMITNTSSELINAVIYDCLGKAVKTMELSANSQTKVDVSILNAGFYFVRFDKGDNVYFTEKLLIK
jgi:hypothetical protein